MANLRNSVPTLEDLDKEARAIQAAGLPYQPVAIKRGEIDLVHSTTFNARFEDRINDDNAMKLAVLYERGVKLPRITVFYDTHLKKYVIISGVHRVTAHELADIQDPIEAFEIVVSPPGDPDTMRKIADLGTVLNNSGPLGLSRAEVLASAIRAVHERGEDVRSVCERYALKTEDFTSAYENWKLDRELIQNGLNPATFTRKGDKVNVLTLPSTAWMKEMERLLMYQDKKGNPVLTGPAFYNVIQQIKHEKNEVARQNIVHKTRESLKSGVRPGRKATGRKGKGTEPYFIWRQLVVRMNDLSPAELAAGRAISGDAANQLREELADVRKKLDEVERAVDARWAPR